MTLVYANVMWVCVCVTVSVYVVVVWQGPMEEQFLYWMDFTLYKYIWKKKEKKNEPRCLGDEILRHRWLDSISYRNKTLRQLKSIFTHSQYFTAIKRNLWIK